MSSVRVRYAASACTRTEYVRPNWLKWFAYKLTRQICIAMREFERLVKPLIESPRERNRALDVRLLPHDAVHATDDLFGAVERGAVGQRREPDQVLLVLCRHEALGYRLEDADGGDGEHRVDAEHHRLASDGGLQAAAVGFGAALKRVC